jgi:serine/threonine protein phosphatase 1
MRPRGRLVAVRDNHELMMLKARDGDDALHDWLANGGDATLASYSPFGDAGRLVDIPEAHWEFLEKRTTPWFETAQHFFVHANAYADMPLAEQPDFMLYWESFHDPQPHQSGKVMICGHTPQKTGLPNNVGHAICIDTCAYRNGWLTCLDVKTGKFWQANQQGECRVDYLIG